jgi:hypothetical protein
MKKYAVLPVILACLAACSNPLLKWVDTPGNTIINAPNNGGTETPAGSRIPSPSDKAITAFSFGIQNEEISIKAGKGEDGSIPVKAILPANTSLTGLKASLTYIGRSLVPPGGTPQTTNPYADSVRSFAAPQVYTVGAADGSEQKYTVQVYVKNEPPAAIVWYDLEIPGSGNPPVMAEGVVTEGSGGQPGSIVLHMPAGTPLTNLTAQIAQTGTLTGGDLPSPNSSTAITLKDDFSNPITYTVSSGGQTRDYVVTVVVDKSPVKEITELSFAGFPNKAIIGAEPQPDGKYPIIATVPVSANPGDLKPVITYKGAAINGAGVSDTRTTNFSVPLSINGDPNQNFSAPVTYTVTAEDGMSRDYEVTVYSSDLNTGKAITGFYFSFPSTQGAQGPAGIINETAKTIAITVPAGTNLRSLAPVIYHTGVSISPMDGAPMDFSNSVANPVIYTVTARDGGTQPYKVSVFVAKRGDKAITAFDFADVSGETVVIGGTPGSDGKIPIVVTVPSSTDLTTPKTPAVTHTGASITGGGIPAGGVGTVTGSPSIFSGPVTYTVTAEDGTTQAWSVTVVKAADPTLQATSNLASIDGFYFNNPMAAGVINGQNITVTVPSGTDVTNLIPTIYFTGNGVAQGTTLVSTPPTSKTVGSVTVVTPYMSSPASIAADFTHSTTTDFTNPVQYTVTPLSLNALNAKTYTVTVNFGPAPPKSDVRAITFFGFDEVDDVHLTAAISTVPDASGNYPVEVIVPTRNRHDINISPGFLLTPVILYKDKDAAIASISGGENFGVPVSHPTDPEIKGIEATASVSFASPRTYKVTAEDGKSSSQYVVTVRIDDNNVKEITAFYFASPPAVGIIDQAAKTITVSVPNGTNLAALSPTVSYTGVSLDPASGRAVNFSSPVIYTVAARNGTVQPYTVRVTPKPAASKDITVFSLPGAGVLETVIGSIPDSDGFIPVSITVSGQSDIAALRPTITHTGVSITPPGGMPQTGKPFIDSARNFNAPQAYRVTAEDGSFKDYAVSVHVSGGGAKVITGFVFKPEDNSGKGLTVPAVGQINQETHTIEVRVPAAVNLSTTLKPAITYLGRSAGYAGTTSGVLPSSADTDTAPAGKNGNTYTDTFARDFNTSNVTPLIYTVRAVDLPDDTPDTQEYTVKVVNILEVTISYDGPRDDKFTTESFDQNNGLLSVTINNTDQFPLSDPTYRYGPTYDWYVDSVRQNVSNTQNTLVIKTAGFPPGRHQVTVSATRLKPEGDGRHYTNTLYFLVRE